MYDFLNSIIKFFPLQLLTAEFLFAFYLKKRSHFWLRFFACCCVFFIVAYFLPYDYMVVFKWLSFKYILLLVLSIGLLWLCFDVSWKETLFCGMAGYAVEHIAFSLMLIVRKALSVLWDKSGWFSLMLYLITFVAVYLSGWALFGRRMRKSNLVNMQNSKLLFMTAVIIAVTQVLSLYVNYAHAGLIICRIYAIAASTVSLLLQFNFFREDDLLFRNEVLEKLLQKGNEQYDISKENIDMINMKCHDIKKNINMILALGNSKDREALIKELEKSIEIYDSEIHTGNEVLNILLMDKNLRCKKDGIKFTCMVNGKALSFLSQADMFSLLGNAIDNAIERVGQEEKDKRVISFKTEQRGNLLYLHLENYSSVKPLFKEGLPQTTKEDKRLHGFGTQSMRYIADKYGGTLRMYHEDNYFNLDILFSLTDKHSF